MRNAVLLSVVAPRVRQNKIVREINRIFRPRNEVIHLPAFAPDWIPAVETSAALKIGQHRPDGIKGRALRTKKKLSEIEHFSQHGAI